MIMNARSPPLGVDNGIVLNRSGHVKRGSAKGAPTWRS